MIKFKIEGDKLGKIKFRLAISDNLKNNRILKRALFESVKVKNNKEYPYVLPAKYIVPIINNINSNIEMDKDSLNNFLEFSDEYEEVFYYASKADVRYMKKWRDEGCPPIFKIEIDKEDLSISKAIVFKRLL